jgi:hypothetical protein
MTGGFVFDDYVNIVDNQGLVLDELSVGSLWTGAWSSQSGPLKRPLAMATLALNRSLNGTDPFYYKVANLVIHLSVGVLLFVLVRSLGRLVLKDSSTAWLFGLSVATLWLLHPLNLTSVLYVVQRMTSLSALFSVLGLIAYVYARTRVERPIIGLALGMLSLLACTGLASLCKETGLLTLVYAGVLEITVLRFAGLGPDQRGGFLKRLYIGMALSGAVVAAITTWYAWDRLTSGYLYREFSMVERLLTQGRALVFYLQQIFVPNLSVLGLFHDDFEISRSLISPITTLPAILLIAGLLALGVVKRHAWPIVSFAILWFFGGHLLESTFLPLEMVHEHRNYLPMVGPLCLLAYAALKTWDLSLDTRVFRFGLAAFILLLAGQTGVRAWQWGNPLLHAGYEVSHHPDSYRTNHAMGRMLLLYNFDKDPRNYDRALEHFERAAELLEHQQKTLFASIQTYYLKGDEPPRQLIDDLLERLRSYPFHPSESVDVQALANCQEKGVCRLSKPDLQAIFDTALANPWLHPVPEADMWSVRARYAAQVLNDWELAETYAMNAMRLQPKNFFFRRNLVQLYLATGQPAKATEQLRAARQNDRLKIHTKTIDTLSRQINSLKGYLEREYHDNT